MQYKYRSFKSVGLKEIFSKNELFFSSPSRFNDPFDCRPRYSISPQADLRVICSTLNIDLSAFEGTLERSVLEASFRNEMKRRANNRGILSLSKTWESILMWSHYSHNHTGICLGFDFSTSKNTFLNKVWSVDYSENNELPELKLEDLLEPGPDRGFELIRKVLLAKHSYWYYEEEVRCIAIATDEQSMEGVQIFEPECIKEVILGAKTSEEDELVVRHWITKYTPHVKLTKLNFSKTHYEVVKVE